MPINNKNPTLIFVHGIGSDYSSWNKQYKFLSENNYSVAGFDIRGHGKSANLSNYEDYSLENSAKDLNKFIDFLGCKNNFVLIGHCLGTSIIQLFENIYPGKTKMSFLLSETYEKINKIMSKLLKYYFKIPPRINTNNQSSNAHRKQNYNVKISDYDIIRIIYAIKKASTKTYASTLSHFFNFNVTNKISSYKTQIVIISGEDDSILRPERSKFIAKNAKNAKLKIIKNANQVILNNNWKEINEIILKELKTL